MVLHRGLDVRDTGAAVPSCDLYPCPAVRPTRSKRISPLPAYLRMFLANSETAVAMPWQSAREKPISSAKREAAINERVASDSELIRSCSLEPLILPVLSVIAIRCRAQLIHDAEGVVEVHRGHDVIRFGAELHE